jgi:hypothetical protein
MGFLKNIMLYAMFIFPPYLDVRAKKMNMAPIECHLDYFKLQLPLNVGCNLAHCLHVHFNFHATLPFVATWKIKWFILLFTCIKNKK